MAKKSIGSLMRKKLSDITNINSHSQQYNNPHSLHDSDTFPSHHDSIQQLLKERTALIQLLAERNKMIEVSGAELQRLRGDIKKLQLQNWNLAQSNSHMLAELNLGRERIKTLQHEILWRAALIKGRTMDVQEKVELNNEKNSTLPQSQTQEGDEKAGQPPPEASNDEQQPPYKNRRHIRSRSIGSSTASKNTNKDKAKDNRRRLRRHSATFKTHEHEPLENLFELEDAAILVNQPGPNMLRSSTLKTETGESSVLRREAPRYSFGRPLRSAVQKVQSYKEIPLNVKMRRLE
ncbi:shugoshin-1 [Abrus precatorius]|uniref:Shugoshin-1 n=1 Tax=Abrus precatorius TaxID=3816 RepID=A0A8B8KWK1_ABRPR|nr:shugoshin-1 [Abrus precatorius]